MLKQQALLRVLIISQKIRYGTIIAGKEAVASLMTLMPVSHFKVTKLINTQLKKHQTSTTVRGVSRTCFQTTFTI